jgi:hypothetical protein
MTTYLKFVAAVSLFVILLGAGLCLFSNNGLM